MIKVTNTTTSRRALLKGVAPAAAATALAAGTLASGLPTAMAGPEGDAELLALKAKFDPLFETWVAMKIKDRDDHDTLIKLYEHATGLRFEDRPAIDWADPLFVAHQTAWKKCLDDFHGQDDTEDDDEDEDEDGPWDKLLAALNPLADEILSFDAETIEGIKLQVRALMAAYSGETWASAIWDGGPAHPAMGNFIQSVCAFTGVPFPPF